jgi:serine/threonine-protein kinase
MQEEINNQSMLKVGKVLRGIYRIDGYLSSGGFGNTYVATNIEFNERVAVKEFFMKGVSQRDDNQSTVSISNTANRNSFLEQKDKFKKEARRLRHLNNPHIVKVYDLFDENGTSYYVMDYIDGENLSERLKRTGKRMSQKTVNEILLQILDALKTVHEAGFWHLDLKPANIMLDKSGNVKLIDFGASKQFDVQKGGATTGTAISYTNGYAPREQMEQNYDKFGPWTDLYALGATLYKLLTNSNPPLPTDIDDDMSEDKHEALPFPATISKDMKGLVLWMMSTNRKKRPQSIEEVERFMKNKPSNATEQESPATGYSNPKPTLASNPSSDSDEGTIVASEEEKTFNEETYAIPSEYLNSPTQTTNKAQSGDLDAMFALGMMNLRGQGILQDTDIAYLWFDKAKEQGDYRAIKIIDDWNLYRYKYIKKIKKNDDHNPNTDDYSVAWFLAISISIILIIIGFISKW